MSEHMLDQLSDYLDDELDSATTAAVARHLAECQACAETLEQLRAVRTWAPGYAGLPTSRDLWPQVKRGIATPAKSVLPWHGRRVTIGLPLLLAASVILVLLSATVVMLMRPGTGSTSIGVPPILVQHAGWSDSTQQATNDQYDAAVAQLEALLATNDTLIEPGTLKVIRQSLMKIDKAINDAQQAIKQDSNNAFLRASIAANMRRKLALLRTAAQAVTAKS